MIPVVWTVCHHPIKNIKYFKVLWQNVKATSQSAEHTRGQAGGIILAHKTQMKTSSRRVYRINDNIGTAPELFLF